MTRETSIAIYRELEANGTLSRKRLEVARDIAYNGPTTAGETWRRLTKPGPQKFTDSYRQRFIELGDRQVAVMIGKRRCAVTQKSCDQWELTGRMPQDFVPRPTRVEQERRACMEVALSVAAQAKTEVGRYVANLIAKQIAARTPEKKSR